MTDTETNKALVTRYFTAIAEGDLAALDEIVSTGYRDHVPGRQRGRAVLKAAAKTLRTAFPDMTSTVTHMTQLVPKPSVSRAAASHANQQRRPVPSSLLLSRGCDRTADR